MDDLVQRTFTACVEARGRFREDGTFKAFLYATARHVLYEHYRLQKREGRPSPDIAIADDDGATPSGLVALGELADVLEIPPGTVASRLRRAKDKLTEKIQGLQASNDLLKSTLTNLEDWARRLRVEAGTPG